MIRIFEKSQNCEIGPGIPYNLEQSHTNLLNSSIDHLSIAGYGDNMHFVRWLEENKEVWGKEFPDLKEKYVGMKSSTFEVYMPRVIVGKYLADTYNKLK